MSFPEDFVWGAATSAHQIEGDPLADGGGLSIWDVHERVPGRIFEGHSAARACNHYHRYREDIGLMKRVGIRSYRFSVSWARVVPQQLGTVNDRALDFYDRLTDELLSHSITPLVTLYHWELPYHLFLRGGWLNPEVPRRFAEYAEAVASRIGDRVSNWVTLNEPQCFVGGYANGDHAPALTLDGTSIAIAVHNAVRAHHYAVAAVRSVTTGARVGPAPVAIVSMPADESREAEDTAREAMWRVERDDHSTRWIYWNNRIWMDALVNGAYPETVRPFFEAALGDGGVEAEIDSPQTSDFLACNIYNGARVERREDGSIVETAFAPGFPRTGFNWPITPDSLYWGPRFLHERYRLPIVITENGISSKDVVAVDGKVHDPGRVDFLTRYLRRLRDAIRDGVDVRGYYYWSFLDNFEWSFGYRERFGLVYVDFETQQRIPKNSASWYADLIKTNGALL